MLGPLHEQQTQPAGCCVNQHCVTGFGQVVSMDEIVRGHPLMRKRRALLKRKIFGQRDQLVCRDHTRFRIGPKIAGVGDTIPWPKFFDAFADSLDDARAIKIRRTGRYDGYSTRPRETSTKLSPAARSLTRTSPAPGSGNSRLRRLKFSGP